MKPIQLSLSLIFTKITLHWLCLATTILLAGCDPFPKDPEGSLEKALQDKKIRVGYAVAPPWVVEEEKGSVSGVEVAIMEDFADELGVEVEWIGAGPQKLFPALINYEIDLAIGGFTKHNPWKAKIGSSVPYYNSYTFIATKPPEADVESLDGKEVFVLPASGLRAALESQDARVTIVEEFSDNHEIIAAERWRIQQLGYNFTEIEVQHEQHMIGIAPGENALANKLDDFIYRRITKERIEQLLREGGAR